MNIISESIPTLKTGRYYLSAPLDYKIKTIWFVFHGYGQLAEKFIKNFSSMADEQNLVIAPEALNKFYLHGFSGEVGATWMTTENRESEIKDYLIFLTNVFSKISSELYTPKLKLNLIGFSQGCSTAVRWLMSKKIMADKIFLCGGLLPKDIDFKTAAIVFKSTRLIYITGKDDKFFTQQEIEKEKSILASSRIDADFVNHKFGHEINFEIVELIKNHNNS